MFGFKKTEYANPGAMNYAFVPNMTLPAVDIQGGGNLTLGQYNVYTAMRTVSYPTLATDGLGGLFAGQMIQQGLIK